MKRYLYLGGTLVAALFLFVVGSSFLGKKAAVQAAGAQAPMFEVDAFWPKPLPNHWLIGSTIGVSVDADDHIWIVHRQQTLDKRTELQLLSNPPETQCCAAAPPVLEFDQKGNLLRHWGGPGKGYDWPLSNHGLTIDYMGNVWIAGAGEGVGDEESKNYHDNMVLKFTRDGQFLLQIGTSKESKFDDIANLGGPTKTFVDKDTNEVYVADGYLNRRIIVFDAETGKYKRHWGAYGHKPEYIDYGKQGHAYDPDAPPAQQFHSGYGMAVHCVMVSDDGFVYVCDRTGDRIQVFKKDGTFVKEGFVAKRTRGSGSVWDLAFSRDPKQTYLYVADGANSEVHILQRDSLDTLTSFGDGGRQPGEFFGVHSIATDKEGNIYTTETYGGHRVQRFVFKGMGPVTKEDQGVVWPKAQLTR